MRDPPKDAKGFELWQAEYLLKYPGLLKSYDTLRECWETYNNPASPYSKENGQ